MVKILWLAPNLNHYKTTFLNCLAEREEVDLTVLHGQLGMDFGHAMSNKAPVFGYLATSATKRNFGRSPKVLRSIIGLCRKSRFDVIMVGLEKKNIPLIPALFLTKLVLGFRLVTYCHKTTKTDNAETSHDVQISKILFKLFDKVIFYTEDTMKQALSENLLPEHKCGFANNTLNVEAIRKDQSLKIRPLSPPALLYIGRLVPYKQIDTLFEIYDDLRYAFPDLELHIIGDGPLRANVEERANGQHIHDHGPIHDEARIAEIMRTVNAVIIPGAAGLSVIHAFAYGKPFVTCEGAEHGPELDYMQQGVTGFRLDDDIAPLVAMLRDEEAYAQMCNAAYTAGSKYSLGRWAEQMSAELTSLR